MLQVKKNSSSCWPYKLKNTMKACFLFLFFPIMHEPTHSFRAFLPLCAWPFFLVHSMHRKLEVSLFMSVEKMQLQFFLAVVSQPISHSSPKRKAEQRRSLFLLRRLWFRTTNRSQHWRGVAGAHMDWVDPKRLKPPCKNLNKFLCSNL